MSTLYDKIATTYDLVRKLPQNEVIIATNRHVLGNITGLRVLDLACGSGYHSNLLLDYGASSVTGIDVSQEMIQQAKAASANGPYGSDRLEFHVGDAADPELLQSLNLSDRRFDLVHGAWLLNYASTADELIAMWRNIAKALKPEGRFVGLIPNVNDGDFGFDSPFKLEKYGIVYEAIESVQGGYKVRTRTLTNPPVEWGNYVLNEVGLFEKCATEGGMKDLKFEIAGPGKEEVEKYGKEFWDEYVKRPHAVVCSAVR